MATSPDRGSLLTVRALLADAALLVLFLGSLGLNAFLVRFLPLHGLTYAIAVGTLTLVEGAMGIRIAASACSPISAFLHEAWTSHQAENDESTCAGGPAHEKESP